MARRKTQDIPDSKVVRAKRRKDRSDRDENRTLSDIKWWLADTGPEAAGRLWNWVDRMRSQWAVDGIQDLIHEAIYADEPIARGGMFDGHSWHGGREAGSCVLNAIKSLVDTASARLTKIRSMPCISADDADYGEKRFARKVSRVLRRKMGAQDIEEMSPLMIRDFCVRRFGVMKVERCGGDTTTKCIPSYEIVFDHREAQFIRYPNPMTMLAHVRPEPRERMMARFPKYAEQIKNAPLFTRLDPWMQFVYQGPALADLIECAESWHPPSAPGCDDGQHIICIRGQDRLCVLREPWDVSRYPLIFAYWTTPMRGLSGKGLVAEHANAQDLINGVIHDARAGIREGSQLTIFANRGANLNKNHMREHSPKIVEVDGPPGQVQFIAPDPVSKQAWNIAFQIKSEMYNISGISEWSATASKPLGNGVSGKALDTMNDNQSDRFAQVETCWQQARVGIGRAHVDIARQMYMSYKGKIKKRFDEQPDPPTKDELASWIRDVPWEKVDIDSGNYNLTLEPVNFISGTRGGKLEDIAEAGKAGLIPDPTMTAALFEEPDIARMNRPILGPFHRIEKCMDGLAELDVDYADIAPDNEMNLPLAKLMAIGELEEAKAEGAEPAVIQRFMNFLSDLKSIEDSLAATQGAPSLAGAQQNTTVAQPNAQTLQAGMAPPPAGPPGASPMPPPMPQGMMQ